jgi:hypothetical protein
MNMDEANILGPGSFLSGGKFHFRSERTEPKFCGAWRTLTVTFQLLTAALFTLVNIQTVGSLPILHLTNEGSVS